jgi:hypothetical protein
LSVYSPFQSASATGQGTYGQAQSYGPFPAGQQARPQDIWDSLGLGTPQQAAQTAQQVAQTVRTISDIVGMLNASPAGQQQQHGQYGQPGQYGQQGQYGQPGQYGQQGQYGPQGQYGHQQARPQDIWGDIGSAMSQAAPYMQQILPIAAAILAGASPAGQHQGMPGQYGQYGQNGHQQARPQGIWGDIGSAFNSAAPTIEQAARTVGPLLPIALAMLSASPAGQQHAMPGQYGQQGMPGQYGQYGQQGMPGQYGQQGMPGQYGPQQARPQEMWGDIGAAFRSAAPHMQQVLPIAAAILAGACPAGQQPGMPGQYGRQY